MRDKDRIVYVCDEIARLWKDKCPDWRFMQLMNNFISWLNSDGFYLEEERFLKKFSEYMETL